MNAPARPVSIALDTARPITIAVLAMGGQGGGVLVDWIVALAERQGYFAQSTSVPGVAQRTGATIYYIEMVARPAGLPQGVEPVLSLMPVPGRVDIVIGAELMEAGRAMQRGLVSPDRTILIASSHRAYAVQEKIVPGDGIGDGSKVFEAAASSSKRFIAFDMAEAAETAGSAVSAVLFGAIAGSRALPFARENFEAAIRSAGVGVDGSLRAFAIGFERAGDAHSPAPPSEPQTLKVFPPLTSSGDENYEALASRAREAFPEALHGIVAAGLQRVVDFQDAAYGADYLDRLCAMRRHEPADSDNGLTRVFAKRLAVAMAYDDIIRVADLKTRSSRFERVRKETGAASDQIVTMTEFMHPRLPEIVALAPARAGVWLEEHVAADGLLARLIDRGRKIRTAAILPFSLLYALGGLRRWRRGTLRHAREIAHIDDWTMRVARLAQINYPLAVEAADARRLVKGYSDTHARGQSKFDKIMRAADRLSPRPDAADWLRRLIVAARADEDSAPLDSALRTIDAMIEDA